ncbi:MAG: M14 family zinc carboxypeptidase [Bacteroidota bacterium]|nr:M14 family zinc carboxypeptidase [Bacteroidota bacterium]
MKKFLLLSALAMFLLNIQAQNINSPEEYLGYKLGTRFTMHHQALDYFKYVAENSDYVRYHSYGKTYEDRELGVVFISSPDNLAELEEIRKANLIKTGFIEGEAKSKQLPFVWLSYNVHGNESVGMEAALKTLYTLAIKSYEGSSDWLKECVVIIDPCQNPDGRDLYANRYRRSQSITPNPNPDDWQHHQGWPSARLNHYLFDLNRDWVWQTQAETEQRIKLYNQYMPHVHADFHEMGSRSTFFFAPGADPWHKVISPWQHEFHELTGKANAELFNQKYRLYFTKESFDLFCPSFGDTWPLFNGAMGFTYEQGGGGYAGLAIDNEAGDTLTLSKRIEGHFLASMATIKVSFENKERLINEFNNYFTSGLEEPIFEYESVIIKGDNDKSAIAGLMELLDKNQVRYNLAGNTGKTYKAFDYLANKEGEVKISEGDLLVSARQAQSHLVKVLFEPDSKFVDSLSYDLTAWALPYVYNLKAYAVKEKIPPAEGELETISVKNNIPDDKPYAYIADCLGFNDLKLMATLLKKKIRLRNTLKPFRVDGKNFKRGSLIVARGDNMNIKGDFDEIVTNSANNIGVHLHPVSSGMVQKGKDLGSNYSNLKYKPEIALIGGEGVSTGGMGELWYFLEREIEYPYTIIGLDYLTSVNLTEYDVILLPSGSYSKQKEKLTDYVKQGGRLVLFEDAIKLFASEESTNLYKAVEARKKEKEKEEDKIASDDTTHLKKYENRRRERLKERSAGSIYRIGLDNTHPYAFGLGNEWFMMRTSSDHYPFLAKGNNIAYILNNEPVAGFAGSEFQEDVKNTIAIASENIGRGEVIYITDSPYYRAYWKSGRILLANILFR